MLFRLLHRAHPMQAAQAATRGAAGAVPPPAGGLLARFIHAAAGMWSQADVQSMAVPHSGEALRRLVDTSGDLKYILRAPHARGTFGHVAHATNASGDFLVAKEVQVRGAQAHNASLPRPLPLDVIAREVAAQQQLDRTGGVVEVLRAERQVFVLMPAASGDLYRLLHRADTARLSAADTKVLMRSVLAQLADALAAHHAKGYVHGDIKPNNAVYDAQGRVRLIDFATAEPVSRSTGWAPMGKRGTVGFMAPENMGWGACGLPSDMWSLFFTFCDFYGPRELHPFLLQPQKMRVYDGLASWRSAQGLDAANAPNYAARPDPMGFGAYFGAVAEHDPEITHFGLKRLLNTAPTQRATAAEFAQFIRTLQPADSAAQHRANKLMQQLATRDDTLDEARNTLQDALQQTNADQAYSTGNKKAEYGP